MKHLFSTPLIHVLTASLILPSCNKIPTHCPSYGPLRVEIDLHIDIPSQNPYINGYVEYHGTNAGYGGVVVVPSYGASGFRAFELSAPHLPHTPDNLLTICDDAMRAFCPTDSSFFMLSNGLPLAEGKCVSPCPLVEYIVTYDETNRVISVRN